MNRKLLYHAFICLLTLCVSSNAQQTFKLNDKVPGWTYNTIAELHDLAKKHLASLNIRIADKKAASESMLNLFFKEEAKKKHDELVKVRKAFLDDQTWTCPHWFWESCGNCGGDGVVYLVKTCSDCNGNKGHHRHGSHPAVDAAHSCSPNTIRALLKVTD